MKSTRIQFTRRDRSFASFVRSLKLRVVPAMTRFDRGQGTVEYALVLVAVTAMVGVVIAYVSGDGGGLITQLFGAAFARMRSLVGG